MQFLFEIFPGFQLPQLACGLDRGKGGGGEEAKNQPAHIADNFPSQHDVGESSIMESLEEAVVVNQLGNLIRRSTGDSSLPDPSQVIRQYFSYLTTCSSMKSYGIEKQSILYGLFSERPGYQTQTSLVLTASLD